MLEIRNLKKSFNKTHAVNIDKLLIKSGEIIGLLGNNGAGKTTLMRLILDLYKSDNGFILSKGINVYCSEHWKFYTGSYLDPSFIIDFYTPEEFFYFSAYLYGITKEEVDVRLKLFDNFMSDEVIGKKKYIRDLSSGNKQKVGIIASILIQPEILILDEPFNFLDPSSQIILKEILIDLNKKKSTIIILSSHNLNHISDLSSRILLMEKGIIIKDIPNIGNSLHEISNYFTNQIK
jgi:ABC-2 type transport system ATP-binding protein